MGTDLDPQGPQHAGARIFSGALRLCSHNVFLCNTHIFCNKIHIINAPNKFPIVLNGNMQHCAHGAYFYALIL